jgi:hypothetical protein
MPSVGAAVEGQQSVKIFYNVIDLYRLYIFNVRELVVLEEPQKRNNGS